MNGVERTLIRQIFDAAPPDAVNLGLGQPDLPTPPVIALAGIRGIAEGKTGYTSTAGNPELRTAVAARYEPFAGGMDHVAITVGTQEAVFATLTALVDPGDEVLYPDPGYPAYATAARLLGARAVPYPLEPENGFRIDAGGVERLLTDRTRVLILCSPSNPTGAIHRNEDLERLATVLREREVAWISDEIYEGFTYGDSLPSMRYHSPEGGLVISGLSKDLSMTGWRIGWVVGPPETVARITAVHQYLVTCAPGISQNAALAALGPAGDAERDRYLEIFRCRRTCMAEELSGIEGVEFDMPDGAFYFFVRVRACDDSLALCRRIIEEARVVTVPGIAFGPRGEGYLRISFAARREVIRRGIRAMDAVLNSWRGTR
jgi:aspartate aminotransferase